MYLLKNDSYLRGLKETLDETLDDIVMELSTDQGFPLLQTPKKTNASVKEEERQSMKNDKEVDRD